jgi:hypothetical protein
MSLKKLLVVMSVLICGLVFISGCGTQPGRTIVTQGFEAEPVLETAPQTGEYMLFTAASPNATATVQLKEGDALGFKKAADGTWIAVAGSYTYDLPKGTVQAYWKLQNPGK